MASSPKARESRRKHREFNDAMADSIDESIRELFSPQVLEQFHNVLLGRYDVSRDELPYRLETAYRILTNVFGMKGAETIGRMIVRRLYQKFGLEFDGSLGLNLMDYVELAKKKLALTDSPDKPP
jgi:hypothetical protein